MTRLRRFARTGVPKTKVCWSVLNVLPYTCMEESNRIGMEDCSITWLTVNAVSSVVAI